MNTLRRSMYLAATLLSVGSAHAANCDRACLEGFVDKYLDAVLAHDPSKVPLAPGVRFTEDGQQLAIGDGLWRSMHAKGHYRLFATDPRAGQVAFFGTIEEDNRDPAKGTAVLMALRLRVQDGKITEIEQIMVRDEKPALAMDGKQVDPIYLATVPAAERVSRAAMIATADKYFTGMQKNDGKGDYPFAEDCNRLENGGQTTNAPTPAGQTRPDPKTATNYSAQWSCMEQFKSGLLHFVSRIRDRRYVAIDEERGIVFAFGFFDHQAGDTRHFKAPDGRDVVGGPVQPWTWEIAELFKVQGGKIHRIQAVLQRSPFGMNSGWSTWLQGMSDQARNVSMEWGIDLGAILARERDAFIQKRPRSRALAAETDRHFVHGVPMHWMRDWATPIPLFIREASCATLTCVDGHRYVDFCLGDSGALFGHSPAPVAHAIALQATRGLATMLPAQQCAEVGAALADLFGLPWWQLTLTATDANRAVLRHARAITGRRKVLVFNHCYHGTVDETLVVADAGTRARPRPGLIGSHVDVRDTVVVEFNDAAGLAQALSASDVACVLAEPVMTNAGMVLPQPGYLEALRAACTRFGTLLVLDETHTLSSGRGGYARQAGIAADFLVCGKAVAGGVPCAVFGCSDAIAARMGEHDRMRESGHSGLGTTLSANPLSLVALLACIREVMTPAAYQHMELLAGDLAGRITAAFEARALPWHVFRVGARLEFGRGAPPLNGSQSLAQADRDVESAIHLYLLNRGFVLTPFHNMMLISPVTTRTQIDGFMKVFEDGLQELHSALVAR